MTEKTSTPVKTSTLVLGEGSNSPSAATVRELTIKEIREWLDEMMKGINVGYVDALLLKGITLSELPRMTSLTMDAIDALCPSELERVLAAARELNPMFFAFRERVLSVGSFPGDDAPQAR